MNSSRLTRETESCQRNENCNIFEALKESKLLMLGCFESVGNSLFINRFKKAIFAIFTIITVILINPFGSPASGQNYTLTVAVLVNSNNPAGYNTSPTSPGEFQKYPERYLEHLQIPYQIFDVATATPPADLNNRQLILIGHKGVNLSAAWQTAIINAVSNGTGIVNLDWDSAIGSKQYVQTIFGATGSAPGVPSSTISVPSNVSNGGANPHFIAGMQIKFAGDPPGDFVYDFHPNENGVIQNVTSTVLLGATGTIIARVGSDPLILAKSYGSGRAVHFGTLEYLKADRFGFLMGIDDLFWRSLVWAARKPFVVRGYPRFWSIQMDDTKPGWGFRVGDMYDPSITGTSTPDGVGGPWKVTGFVYTDNLPPGSSERVSVIDDIQQGNLQISPHSYGDITYGNLYWNASNGELTDAQWLSNLNSLLSWKQGSGGSDAIPFFSRSWIGHFWDISDNTGYDAWNTLGFRYVTSIQKPGFQNFTDVSINGGAERLNARPFWLYEKPPKTVRDENYPFFFADDYTVNSRAGLSSKKFFLFATQLQDPQKFPRADIIWPSSNYSFTTTDSIEQFKQYTWRFWSSLCPVQIYTHDSINYEFSSQADRRAVISSVSSWLNEKSVKHEFMEDLGDYIYARTKSSLNSAVLSGDQVTFTFAGNATHIDGSAVETQLDIYFNESSDGAPITIPGFTGGGTFTFALPSPPPTIANINPNNGPTEGGTPITISGSNFINVQTIYFGNSEATNLVVLNSNTISAVTPPGVTGPVDIVLTTASGVARSSEGFMYLGSPIVDSIEPYFGSGQGGTLTTITGRGFEFSSTVRIGGALATGVTVEGSTQLTFTTPPGTPGSATVEVSNTYGSTLVPGGFFYLSETGVIPLDFAFGSRDDLLAAGWDFLARSAFGNIRNTEQTSGLVVSYDQNLHPGAIRLPIGNGDLWQNTNDTSNSLFFNLPSNWRSIKLKMANFNPGSNYQQVALAAYEDDDNYVILSRNYNNGQSIEFAGEDSGSYSIYSQVTAPTSSNIFLRLDRALSTDTLTAFISIDGNSWTALPGAVNKVLTNSRLAVINGANLSDIDIPEADIEYAEIVVFDDPASVQVTPLNLNFSAFAGGLNPQSQSLTISNAGGGTLSWTASENGGWLSLSSTSGTAPSTISVAVDISNLATGTYSGVITIANPNAANSPVAVPVTLTVASPGPPTITNVEPAYGSIGGGTTIAITGNGFTANTTVSIGGNLGLNIAVNSSTSISAVTPPGTEGLADVIVQTGSGTGILADGFNYVTQGSQLLGDDFNDGTADGWTVSPLGYSTGWSVANGIYTYSGIGHTQSYSGSADWTDYTLEVDFRLSSLNNYPGGIRGRVNPATGAGYTVWLYPATGEVKLFRATGWNIDSPGLVQLGATGGITFDTANFHTLRLTFTGELIDVSYDGQILFSATDTAYSSGVVALDVSNQPVEFDNIKVTFGTPVGPATLLNLTAIPSEFTLNGVGATQQLAITGEYNDGTFRDLTSDPTTSYTTDAASIATVNALGLVTAQGGGSATITALNSGVTATSSVTVNLPPTISTISPATGSTEGGTALQITGSGFVTGTTVEIGGNLATDVVVNSVTSMSAILPPGVEGPADVIVTNVNGSATLTAGFSYVVSGSVLLQDDFNDGTADGWIVSPLGHATGWNVVNEAYTFDGSGHTQSYAGSADWTDYTLEVDFRLSSLNNYPGGIRGRVNPTTGAGYALWLYPATGEVKLFRATGWNIDSPGLTLLGSASGVAFDNMNFHPLRLTFNGDIIEVYYNGQILFSATDTVYSSGGIAIDVSNQPIEFDNVKVTFGVPAEGPPPINELLRDDFNDGNADGWTISPLGHATNWSAVNGVYSYDGSGHNNPMQAARIGRIIRWKWIFASVR